ncbi:hypothetical protein GCM10027038_23820 [Arthrobacter bambusae]
MPDSTAGLACAGELAAWTVDPVPAPAGTAAAGAAAARAAVVGAVAVGDPGTGAACGRPDPDGGADAVVVLSVPAVVLEVEGAPAPESRAGTVSGPEAGAITVRRQAASTATGTAIRLNVSPDSHCATVPMHNSGNGSLCGAL